MKNARAAGWVELRRGRRRERLRVEELGPEAAVAGTARVLPPGRVTRPFFDGRPRLARRGMARGSATPSGLPARGGRVVGSRRWRSARASRRGDRHRALRAPGARRAGSAPSRLRVATARRLALEPPGAVLHVGIAGCARHHAWRARDRKRGRLLRHLCRDPVVDRLEPDARLLGALREALPEALSLPIGTSAAVGGALPTYGSRGWRASECSAPARSRACRRSRCARSRTRSPRATVALADRPGARGARRRAPANAGAAAQ